MKESADKKISGFEVGVFASLAGMDLFVGEADLLEELGVFPRFQQIQIKEPFNLG